MEGDTEVAISIEAEPKPILNILAVDDEPSISTLIKRQAERFAPDAIGVFDTAVSGEEALKRISEEPDRYNVVITDLQMPGMNGIQVADAVRERAPKIGVYLISSAVGSVLSELEQHDIKGFLVKPFTPDQIKEFIGKVRSDIFAQGK